jgi:hypothetical protein
MQNPKHSLWRIADSERARDLGIIFLIPIILLLNNENWLYTEIGWTDPWSYLGRFLFYDSQTFDDYKVARFPWIWSGFAAYRLFSPETATVVLSLSYFYLALFSFYLILTRLFSTRSAFVATVLLACYMEFQGSYGWLYHNMAATALYLLSLLLLIHAATVGIKRRFVWLFMGGGMLLLAVCTNMAYLPFTPIPLIFFYFIHFRDAPLTKRQVLFKAGGQLFWIISGGILTAALITHIHGAVTGIYYVNGNHIPNALGLAPGIIKIPFFLTQLEYSMGFQQWIAGEIATGKREIIPFAIILKNSSFLVIPVVLFVISLGRLGWLGAGIAGFQSGKRQPNENRRYLPEVLIYAQHVIVCLAYFYLYAKGSPIFWASYVSFPLIGSSFLAIGAFLFRFGSGARFFSYPALRLIALTLSVLPLIILFHSLFLERFALRGLSFFILPLIFCVVSFSLLLSRKYTKLIFVIFLTGFMSFNILAANRPYLVNPYIYDKCYSRKDAFLASFDGIMYLDSIDTIHTNTAYLYDYYDEPAGDIHVCERNKQHHLIYKIAVSVSVARVGWGSKINFVENDYVYHPGHPRDMVTFIRQFPTGKKIAVISSLHSSEDRLSRLRSAADSENRTIKEIDRKIIRRGDVAYEIVVFSVP